jgi:hypothetical protein
MPGAKRSRIEKQEHAERVRERPTRYATFTRKEGLAKRARHATETQAAVSAAKITQSLSLRER